MQIFTETMFFYMTGCARGTGQIGEKPTDLVFMMDMSASLLQGGFQKEKDFISSIIKKVCEKL